MKTSILFATLLLGLFSCATTPHRSVEKMIVEFPVHTEKRAEFISAINKVLVDTRAFDGCVSVTVWTNEKDNDTVWLYEEWASREHQVAYLNWRSETGNTSHLSSFLSGAPRFLWLEQH